jgi:hypothetical protein
MQETKRTRKPTAAGILCIVTGAIGMIPVIWVALLFALAGEGWARAFGALLIVVGVIPIVGGIYALRRKVWRLALAGAIFALIVPVIFVTFAILLLAAGLSEGMSPLPTIPEILARIWYLIVGLGIPGVLAIVFVSFGKREFK